MNKLIPKEALGKTLNTVGDQLTDDSSVYVLSAVPLIHFISESAV